MVLRVFIEWSNFERFYAFECICASRFLVLFCCVAIPTKIMMMIGLYDFRGL